MLQTHALELVMDPRNYSETGTFTMTDTNQNLATIRKFDRAVRQVRAAIDPFMSTQLVNAFLGVALNEGCTLTEIADSIGTNLSTASRQLLDLGERNRKMQPGFGLIQVTPDPMNLRVNRYSLTPKGKLVISEIDRIMKD